MYALKAAIILTALALPSSVTSLVPYRVVRQATAAAEPSSTPTTLDVTTTTEAVTNTSLPTLYHHHPDHHGNETEDTNDNTTVTAAGNQTVETAVTGVPVLESNSTSEQKESKDETKTSAPVPNTDLNEQTTKQASSTASPKVAGSSESRSKAPTNKF